MERFIPLSIPNFEGNEKKYVNDALSQGWVSTGGKYITELEKKLEEFLKVKKVVACQSGTAALHLALMECGVQPKDLVIVPTLTFIAAVNPVMYQFASPIFMDCDDSLCMDVQKLRRFCESECDLKEEGLFHRDTGKQIKALVVVHVFGNLADMESIMEIAEKFHFKVVEDATEALGSRYISGRYAGKFAGTIGDFGAYSFNGNKIITTSGGGMLVSNEEALVQEARVLSTQARDPARHYQHSKIGYNYRMSNVLAGIGRGQLMHLDEHLRLKKAIYTRYKEAFADIDEIAMNPLNPRGEANNWLSCMTIKEGSCVTPDLVMDALEAENIESRPIWKPMHLQPIFSEYDFFSHNEGKVSVSEDIFVRGVCLPSDIKNTEADMEKVICIVRRLFEGS